MLFYAQGNYTAVIVAQAVAENNKGNPEVQLTIKPTARITTDGAKTPIPDNTYTRTIFLTLTDKTIGTPHEPGWIIQALHNLGFNGTSFSDLDPSSPNHHSFVGLEPFVNCTHSSYNGKDSEKWNLSSATQRTVKPVGNKALAQLDAKHGKVLKQIASQAPAAPPPPMAAALTADGDIPF